LNAAIQNAGSKRGEIEMNDWTNWFDNVAGVMLAILITLSFFMAMAMTIFLVVYVAIQVLG